MITDVIIEFLEAFKDYFIDVLPWVVIGFFLSGLIHEFVPTEWVEKHLGGKGIKPLLYSTLAGTVLPICCWGALPVAVSLQQKGARLGPVFSLPGSNTSYLCNRPLSLLCAAGDKVHRVHILCRDLDGACCRRYWEPHQV